MNKALLKFATIILLLFSLPAKAEMEFDEFNGAIYVNKTTVAELEELFAKNHYKRFRGLENDSYPAIFLKSFPTDFMEITSQKYRNELFIRILAPLAIKLNQEFSNEQSTLQRYQRKLNNNQELSEKEIANLNKLAIKYDYFIRAEGKQKIQSQLNNLLLRVNIIPPSIFVAYAAMETNWGFSRLVAKANSLYKEKVWYTNEGLEPLENKDDGYRFKIFNSLMDSMRSFAITFNSDLRFRNVWGARAQAILRQENVIGESMAYSLSNASNLPNFVGILDYTTAFYDLIALDNGHLKNAKR